MIRCYECKRYKPRTETRGYCVDLKEKVYAVDYCSEAIPKEKEKE